MFLLHHLAGAVTDTVIAAGCSLPRGGNGPAVKTAARLLER